VKIASFLKASYRIFDAIYKSFKFDGIWEKIQSKITRFSRIFLFYFKTKQYVSTEKPTIPAFFSISNSAFYGSSVAIRKS
jgi:hypothetical protein